MLFNIQSISSLFGRDFFCLLQPFSRFFFEVGMPVLGIKSSKTTPCLNIYILMQVYAIMLICIEWRLQLSCPLRLYSWKIKIFWHLCLHFFHQLKKEVKCFVWDSTKGKIFLKASLVASISSKFSAVYLDGMYNKAYTLCHIVKAI